MSVGGDKDSGFVEERRVSPNDLQLKKWVSLEIDGWCNLQGGRRQEINLSYRPHTCFPQHRSTHPFLFHCNRERRGRAERRPATSGLQNVSNHVELNFTTFARSPFFLAFKGWKEDFP